MRRAAVLAPGYGGTAEQAILRALASALETFEIASRPITFRTRGSRPSKDYASEIDDFRAARDALRGEGHERIALVGRSFGGRIAAFLAEQEPPDALVILGHPIAPPTRPRPRDEAALAGTLCPTLVVQGDKDELGPYAVLERIAASNPRIDLIRIAGAGHDFGAREPEAVAAAARWLDSVLR
ncbi:MAG TPA: alpha/beta family hydrolase [Candidatus Bathyarchaeia archaeon]|nr:alpha/beta family hydrolase [Candidatus Bathyarchaeia archaeon]